MLYSVFTLDVFTLVTGVVCSFCAVLKLRVTTCLENLEMSGKCQGEKLPKTVYCKQHICIHNYMYLVLVRA